LEHIPDLGPVFNEIHRVLKADGMFVAGYPVKNRITKSLLGLLGFNDDEIHPSDHEMIVAAGEKRLNLQQRSTFPGAVPRALGLYEVTTFMKTTA
jgi:hypothetical protein